MAPTLFTVCNALPPEGAVPPKGGLSAERAPTLFTVCNALPPAGAVPPKGGLSAERAPTLAASPLALPPEGAGLFISFEGIDGAGKSTHIAALAEAFKAQGRAVTLTREPGGTLLAEKLRVMVLGDAMDPLTEALLIFAARRDHLARVIAPALARGDVVLCDRFTDATFAYQGAGRGFDLKLLATLEQWVQSEGGRFIEPQLTVWFDLPPEDAAARLQGARAPDKFEAQPIEFFRKVARGYADRRQGHPQRFARIDASQSRETVWHAVLQVFLDKGWLS